MNPRSYQRMLFFILISATGWSGAHAQETFTLGEGSRIWVEGTSTLRNWSAEVKSFEGKITTDTGGEVTGVSLTMDVKSMDGGRGPDMNAKIYNALLAEQHPKITFEGKKGTSAEGDVATFGALSLAGKSKELLVSAMGSAGSGHLTGQQKLKFSDFSIEPPSALFGQIVCHDDITIMFDLKLSK